MEHQTLGYETSNRIYLSYSNPYSALYFWWTIEMYTICDSALYHAERYDVHPIFGVRYIVSLIWHQKYIVSYGVIAHLTCFLSLKICSRKPILWFLHQTLNSFQNALFSKKIQWWVAQQLEMYGNTNSHAKIWDTAHARDISSSYHVWNFTFIRQML